MTRDVGIIGLGLLGGAIAQRLTRAGYALIGFDPSPASQAKLTDAGQQCAATATDVFQGSQKVILSLPNSAIAQNVIDENIAIMAAGQVVIDTTTGDPDQMAAIASRLASRGISYLEANVSGSSAQVLDGTAVLLLGGPQEDFNIIADILRAVGEKQFYLGGPGSGARFKLVHNLILGLHRAVLAEGLAFAEQLGFDPTFTLDVLRETPAASRVMETKGMKMVAREYAPQAKLSQHLKDVELILAQGARCGVQLPLSEVHRMLLQYAETIGFGDADNSAIREAYH